MRAPPKQFLRTTVPKLRTILTFQARPGVAQVLRAAAERTGRTKAFLLNELVYRGLTRLETELFREWNQKRDRR